MSARRTRTSAESRRTRSRGAALPSALASASSSRPRWPDGVVAAQFDDGRDLATAIGMDPLVRVADIACRRRLPGHGRLRSDDRTGHLCVWEAPRRRRASGAEAATRPTIRWAAGHSPSASLRRRAGRGRRHECHALRPRRIRGRARTCPDERRDPAGHAPEDASSSGSDELRVFGYRFKKADLRRKRRADRGRRARLRRRRDRSTGDGIRAVTRRPRRRLDSPRDGDDHDTTTITITSTTTTTSTTRTTARTSGSSAKRDGWSRSRGSDSTATPFCG